MDRIVTAVYPNRQEAEAAKAALQGAKVDADNIHIIDRHSETGAGRFDNDRGRYSYLRDSSIPGDELHTYHDALDRGETLVQARVDDADVTEAVRILEGGGEFGHGGIDLDEREKSYTDEHRFGTRQAYNQDYASATEYGEEESIDLVEERLRIGKRERDAGSLKVRSYVVEKPVEADVTLREEKVKLERHPANRVLSKGEAAAAFGAAGKTVEVHARSEEAVIEKDAVLKETIDVEKIATERTKHVVDTIRETEVEIEGDPNLAADADRDGLTDRT